MLAERSDTGKPIAGTLRQPGLVEPGEGMPAVSGPVSGAGQGVVAGNGLVDGLGGKCGKSVVLGLETKGHVFQVGDALAEDAVLRREAVNHSRVGPSSRRFT